MMPGAIAMDGGIVFRCNEPEGAAAVLADPCLRNCLEILIKATLDRGETLLRTCRSQDDVNRLVTLMNGAGGPGAIVNHPSLGCCWVVLSCKTDSPWFTHPGQKAMGFANTGIYLQKLEKRVAAGVPKDGSAREQFFLYWRGAESRCAKFHPKHRMCNFCDTSTSKRCTGCHYTLYCSRACQKKDWTTHRHFCKYAQKWFTDGPIPYDATPTYKQFFFDVGQAS